METIQQQMKQKVVPIEYVGKKDYKTDNVNHTKTIWSKPGDVQPYPLEKAASLLRYPDVWKLGNAKQLADATMIVDDAGAIAQAAPQEKKEATKAAESRDTSTGPTMGEAKIEGPEAAASPSRRSLE